MTGTIDTNAGTYTTASAFYVEPNLVFLPQVTAKEESGVPFTLNVGYNGNPIPTYTIDWGDGSTYTGTARYLTHAYSFSSAWPNSSYIWLVNDRDYTFSASEGSQSTMFVGGGPAVYP